MSWSERRVRVSLYNTSRQETQKHDMWETKFAYCNEAYLQEWNWGEMKPESWSGLGHG